MQFYYLDEGPRRWTEVQAERASTGPCYYIPTSRCEVCDGITGTENIAPWIDIPKDFPLRKQINWALPLLRPEHEKFVKKLRQELEKITDNIPPLVPGLQFGKFRMVLSSAGKIPDFLWPFDPFIHERVYKIFKKEGITGWEGYEVEIVKLKRKRKNPLPLPKIYEFIVTGTEARYRPGTWRRLISQCEVCGYRRHADEDKGIYVDESTWDGSDVFSVQDCAMRIVTERFKEVVEKYDIQNVALIPAEEATYKRLLSLWHGEEDD